MKNVVTRWSSRLLNGTWDLNSDHQAIFDLALKFSDKELAPKANE